MTMTEFPHRDLLRYFLEISAIPRASGKEAAIADYLCDFARAQGLFYSRDAHNNVFIRRQASAGYTDHPAIGLQGHTDMVCEKLPTVEHDFDVDPIHVIEQDGYLTADGTTLGADNGAAVAVMLALLSDPDYCGPMLECLFTSDEECGMNGAKTFDTSLLTARRFINLDTESTEKVMLGSAGNATLRLGLPVAQDWSEPQAQPLRQALRIKLFGLASGHSGADIHLGHQNAILLCASLLLRLYEAQPFALISFEGGGRANVIPKECEVTIAVTDAAAATEFLKAEVARIYPILCRADSGMKLHVNRVGVNAPVLSFSKTGRFLRALALVPNGVLERMPDEDFVLTSSNLGILSTAREELCLVCMTRSMRMDAIDRLCDRFAALAKACELSYEESDRSPAWEKIPDGAFARTYFDFYRAYCGRDAKGVVVHAGLECGLLQSRIGADAEFISIGPYMQHIHTVEERMELESFAQLYSLLLNFLKSL